jgi:hypothetical protein
MNNEIGRKITSLTLMTIMLAGGMTIAAPGFMPAAFAANANLFVSAENSQFDNYMSGPQVIEVVVIDSDIHDTNEGEGEPDVTVNGKTMRMVQATDGNWYGYFADKTMAQTADAAATTTGSGLDFGAFCDSNSSLAISTNTAVTVTDTVGIAVGDTGVGTQGLAAITTSCTAGFAALDNQNVLREQKDVNQFPNATSAGQIGIDVDVWPFIQLYALNPTGNVVVQYNKGGGVQSTTLTFDTVDQFAGASLDRSVYPNGAQVHATITDLWLNIDPTDEDSWTFGTNSANATSQGAYYQVFTENGGSGGTAINIKSSIPSLMCEDNCNLIVNANTQGAANNVLTLQDNDDSILTQLNTTASSNNATAFGVSAETGLLGTGSVPITFTEQGPNSGVFGTYDESDSSVLKITSDGARGTSATIDYNETPATVLVGFDFATIDIQATDDEWNSGEEIPVVIVDGDANKNSRADEDLDLNDPNVTLIPSLSTGDPFTLGEGTNSTTAVYANVTAVPSLGLTVNGTAATTVTVDSFSQIGRLQATASNAANAIVIDFQTTLGDLRSTLGNTNSTATDRLQGFNLLNLDVRSFNATGVYSVYLLNNTVNIIGTDNSIHNSTGKVLLTSGASAQSGLISLNTTAINNAIFDEDFSDSNVVGALIYETGTDLNNLQNYTSTSDVDPIVIDFFSFGFNNDGLEGSERIANQIIRIEAEESGDNTSTFQGTLEYIMINQLNIRDVETYTGLSTIADDPNFIVIEDLTDEDSPRVNYLDLGSDGVSTQVADQEEAPSHSGVVSFDSDSYKEADTVTITLEDLDLNVDSDLVDIYTVVLTAGDANRDVVGDVTVANSGTSIALSNGDQLGRLLDVTFNDALWTGANESGSCTLETGVNNGLGETGFTLVETGSETGTFIGDFQIPAAWCKATTSTFESVTGLDIEVNYVDFRDASGEIIEVGDSAGVRANTGSISLDRTVYPVPFGVSSDFATAAGTTPTVGTNERSLFPIHQSGVADTAAALATGEFLTAGDLTIHVRVNDPDWDISASGEDSINKDTAAAAVGPVKISVLRGSDSVVLGYAGGPAAQDGQIDVADNLATSAREFGPMSEIAPDAGIFEIDVVVRYTDGPESSLCPDTTVFTAINGTTSTAESARFDAASASASSNYCILQGDILQVEYTDPADASGEFNTVTDSATFDLRNGVLQSDKSVYIIGSDMILTLIEPDFDLDNDQAETYDLDLIEWDSDAATVTMGDADGEGATFDPEPLNFRETGDSTGIFQIVIEIPQKLEGDNLERGEEIILEYTDWGPSGSDYVGDEDEDVNLTIFTSNFGATVELDQKVYSWTDKVYITIVAPDHNFDGDLIDEIGNSASDPIKVSTRGFNIDQYKLVETGTDTGIFTGEVILTGFTHDASGDGSNDITLGSATGKGPTDGKVPTDDDDGLTVSFEFSEDETVVGSSLIRWNIGEVQWLEASYPASGTGVVRVIDPDMNLDPEAVDNFDVDVWSDSDAGGIDLTVTETNEATGIYEGTVFFTVSDESSGHRLRVAEGDTVTAEYEDNTLPDPYTTADELDITATSLIGTVVPPLERAPAANLRTVDAFGNSLDAVSVDQQVQISADLANGQDREQSFAYLVQIQDGNGVTVSLAWITGSLSSGQSFSPALSWIPTQAGTYTATAFVWESVDNPTALSPPVYTTVTVQ